jgi:hypothetical protein
MAEIKTPDISLTGIGNALGGLALAFGIDNILMGGTVTGFLPDVIVGSVAFVVFAGAAVYGYKQLKKLN